VKSSENSKNSRVTNIIESRSPAGRHDSVQGWHNLLIKILLQMGPYLKAGHLVTFRRLEDQEIVFFEKLRRKVIVPDSVGAIYIPPSVRFQMLYQRPEGQLQPIPENSPDNPPDKGIVLASQRNDFGVVINTLLAKPPYAPASDVYEKGQLLAGYVYNTIDECITDLTKVLQIHLPPKSDQK
jgi:hypothetical protein